MGRSPCCSKVGLHRGQWTSREDSLLSSYIQTHGEGNWKSLPKKAGLLRCGKSCRLRWMNYLRPDIKRGNITQEEEDLIIRLRSLLGNRWSLIAGRLPGRTDNEIKNYWNSHLSKKLKKQGFVIPEQCSPPRRGPRSSRDRKTPTDHHNSTCRPVGDHEIFAPKPIRITATKFATGATPTCSGDSDGDAAGNPKAVDQNCESSDSLGVDFDLDSADWDLHFRDQPVFDSLFHEYSLLLNSDVDQDLHFMDPFSLMNPLSDSLTGPLIRSTDFMSTNLYVSRVR